MTTRPGLRGAQDLQCFGLVAGSLEVLRRKFRRVDEPLPRGVFQASAAPEENQPVHYGERQGF